MNSSSFNKTAADGIKSRHRAAKMRCKRQSSEEILQRSREKQHSLDVAAGFYRRLWLSQNAGRAREGFGLLKFQSWPAACTATTGADFSPEKSLPCRFCGRNPQDSSKIWIGWPWRGSLLPHPSSLLGQAKAAERLVQPPLCVRFRNNDRFGGKTAPRSGFSRMNPPEFPFRFRRQEACRPFSTCL